MTRQYGLGTAQPAVRLSDEGGGVYSYKVDEARVTLRKVVCWVDPSAAGNVRGHWNADSVSTSGGGWDFVIQPGQMTSSPDGINVSRVAMIGTGTYGTHWVLYGWE